MTSLAGVILLFATAAAVALMMLILGSVLGPRRKSPTKMLAFECGNPPSGDARARFSIKFYLIAIMFVLFDVEVAFMYPWAVLYRKLGLLGFIEMGIFALILGFGLFYVWRRGVLEWD